MVKKFEFSDGSTCDARNYYGDLGLKVGLWGEQGITKAYKKLSLKYHPDKRAQRGITEEEANERMRIINAAKDILLEHEGELRNLLLWGEGSQVVPKFKCAGCHSESSLLFKEHTNKNGTALKYCNYFCLPDCTNELSGDKECKSKYGKCWKNELKRSKEHGIFCSDWCLQTFKKNLEEQENWEDKWKCIKCKKTINSSYYTTGEGLICADCWGDEGNELRTCPHCQEKFRGGCSFTNDPQIVFCSEKCAFAWKRKVRDKKELKEQRVKFIDEDLKILTGWNLLSDEEKQNFVEQVNQSEPEHFEIILKAVKNLIKQKTKRDNSEQETQRNNGNFNNQNEEQEEEDNSQNIPEIPDLSLIQSQARAEQEIQKVLKENNISEEELKKENLLEGVSWKDYLKNLDTPAKVEEFVSNLKQIALKIKLAKQGASKDPNPKNKWVVPAIILTLSFLALTSLVLIIRKRKQRGF